MEKTMNENVQELAFGEGVPKICVPVLAATNQELLEKAAALTMSKADLIEWRADAYQALQDEDAFALEPALGMLRAILEEKPILFNLRNTVKEGNNFSAQNYLLYNTIAAKSGYVDILNIELAAGTQVVKTLVNLAKKSKITSVVSSHYFVETPSQDDMVDALRKMRNLGADIPKLVVTAQTADDLNRLYAAAVEYKEEYADSPFIIDALGKFGALAKISSSSFGSVLSYASAEEADDNISLVTFATVLEVLHLNETRAESPEEEQPEAEDETLEELELEIED